jgi:hypothetical protein
LTRYSSESPRTWGRRSGCISGLGFLVLLFLLAREIFKSGEYLCPGKSFCTLKIRRMRCGLHWRQGR